MKAFLAALIIFFLLLSVILFNAIFLEMKIEKLERQLLSIPLPQKEQKDLTLQHTYVENVVAEWKRNAYLFSLSVSHQDLMEVELQFSALQGASAGTSYDDYITCMSQLLYALSHLKEMSEINFANVL